MRADDHARPALAPLQESFNAHACDRHVKQRAHGGAHRLDRPRIGGLADENDAFRAGAVGGADDGAEIAGITNPVKGDPQIPVLSADCLRLQPALAENADNHLRIVAAGNGGKHLFAGFQNERALCPGAGGHCLHGGIG